MKRTVQQQQTIQSFQRVNDYIYTLQYHNAYGLKRVLQKGIRSVGGLLGFILREMRQQRKSFACSTFNVKTQEGKHLLGRNFDYMEAPLLVLWTAPETGYKSLSVCNCTFMLYGKKSVQNLSDRQKGRLLFAPYTCMDGINEEGLSIAVLEIKTKATNQKKVRTPQTTTTVIRAVLDTCATVEDAVKVFENCAMHDSIFCNYHFQIADRFGKSVLIEYVQNEMKVYSSDKSQSVTNFFVSKEGDNSNGFGYERKEYIDKTLAEKKVLSEGEAMKVLQNCHLNYTHKRGYQIITLWSAVYNCTDRTMKLCAGLHYDTVYTFDVNRPGEVVKTKQEMISVPDFPFAHIDKEMAEKFKIKI